ncbi:MAG: CpsD/CapB family tyrosine-protein kinase [Clostridia bacterium]|nr:CpsD/CapB family tyrosine-protein kinase [Clostridia bacterium]
MSNLLFDNNTALGAAYDVIRANLLVRLGITPHEKGNCPVVAVSTVGNRSQRREMTLNLAISLARLGLRVLLADADFRTKGIAPILGVADTAEKPLATAEPTLFFLPRGNADKNPTDLLGSAAFLGRLQEWRAEYDVILLALPPAGIYADTLTCAPYTDGVVLGVTPGRDKRATLTKTLEALDAVGAKLLGMINCQK